MPLYTLSSKFTILVSEGSECQDETSRFIRDPILLKAIDKLAATVFALMVLFAVVDVAVFLEALRVTLWTGLSDDHR